MAIIIEHEIFSGTQVGPLLLDPQFRVFRFVTFQNARFEGGNTDAAFLDSEFELIDHYWGIYNQSVFVDFSFSQCKFRGTAFADCKFMCCKFKQCQFLPDNLGGTCNFDGSKFMECTAVDCEGLPRNAGIVLADASSSSN